MLKPNISLVPYLLDESAGLRMLFVRKEGQLDWEISTGGWSGEENTKEARINEAADKVGVFTPFLEDLEGLGQYGSNSLYIAKVIDINEVSIPTENYEAAWLTFDEFKEMGRRSQHHIVKSVSQTITRRNRQEDQKA